MNDTESLFTAVAGNDATLFVKQEIRRIRAQHGKHSGHELDFLARVGKARSVKPANGDTNPFRELDARIDYEMMTTYRWHMNDMFTHNKADVLHQHKDPLVGWLNYSKYQNPHLILATAAQTHIAMELSLALDKGPQAWSDLGRAGRIDELDLVAQAAQHIMRKRSDIPWKETVLRECVDGAIVTDDKNPNAHPDQQAPDAYDIGLLKNKKIYFAHYANADETADRHGAYKTLAHENAHRLSKIWRTYDDPYVTNPLDMMLERTCGGLVDLFKKNAEQNSSLSNIQAQDAVYVSTPEERLARSAEKYVGDRQSAHKPSYYNLLSYCNALKDDERFTPIVRTLNDALSYKTERSIYGNHSYFYSKPTTT